MTQLPDFAGLLPQQLRGVWQEVTDQRRTREAAVEEEARLLDERRRVWIDALIEPDQPTLETSLLGELASYVGVGDLDVVRGRCRRALEDLKTEWTSTVRSADPASIESYYRRAEGTLYELTWWHTLVDDPSPLAYVNALELARLGSGRSYLDFGSGVGSGGLLFARAGFEVTLADVSLPLLAYCRWRFARRHLTVKVIDTGIRPVPEQAFDVITAMDVFEHLPDAPAVAAALARALRPGGILVARLHAETDPDRPQHIVTDFAPVFQQLKQLGCEQIWEDDWLWGHQAFKRQVA